MKTKSAKRFTKRQKIILLVAAGLLLVIIIASVVLVAKLGEETKSGGSVSHPQGPSEGSTSSPPNDKNDDNQNLVQARGKAITTLEEKISTEKVKTSDLLQELKTKHNLPASETDWKKYLAEATTTTELEERKKKVWAIIGRLTGNPSPSPQPENQWQKILREIREFIQSNPATYQKVKDWINEKNTPNHLRE